MSETSITKEVQWSAKLEDFFKHLGERSQVYSMIHKDSDRYFTSKAMYFDLPVIIIGSLNGFVSASSQQIMDGFKYSTIIVGVISLFVSLLSTISNYYAYGRKAESHKIMAIEHSRLFRNIEIQLTLPVQERILASELLRSCKDTVDRLSEISPKIPKDILAKYNKKLKNLNIQLPEDLGNIKLICINRITTERSENILIDIDSASSDGVSNFSNTSRDKTSRQTLGKDEIQGDTPQTPI